MSDLLPVTAYLPDGNSYRINDSDDPFERMLAVIRFSFTKDLKFVVGFPTS